MNYVNFSAIILAAGLSSRMKYFKPLLEISGKPAIAHLVDSFIKAKADEIIIVVGHDSQALENYFANSAYDTDKTIRLIKNDQYLQGMYSSIKAGVMAANGKILQIIPADQPLVDERTIHALYTKLSATASQGHTACIPVYMGKNGHPIAFHRDLGQLIMEDTMASGGLKKLFERENISIDKLDLGDMGSVLDMDDFVAYNSICDYARDGDLFVKLHRDLLERTSPIYLIRHGRIKQHSDKIFLGQYDPELSVLGRADAKAAADRLKNTYKIESAVAPIIFSSTLTRARQTAEQLLDSLDLREDIKYMSDLNEIDLGTWDGRYIFEIKEQFPSLFEERGADILGFKKHGGESFYDLRFRVLMGLREVLKNTADNDTIIIITHKMVIQAICGFVAGQVDNTAISRPIAYGEIVDLLGN